jgi:nicotinamidase-related amidase
MTQSQSDIISIDPNNIAVVLIDFQNGFCQQSSNPVDDKASNRKAALHANEFAASASRLGAKIVYTKQILDPEMITPRQRQWAIPENICPKDSWESELFLEPVPVATVVTKYRFDVWQSEEFLHFVEKENPEGFVFAGVELCCCVLFAILGADERGYRLSVPIDLVSGIDSGSDTYNKAVREYLKLIYGAPDASEDIIKGWQSRR